MTRPGQATQLGYSRNLNSRAEARAVRALIGWGILSFVTFAALTLLSVTV